MALQMGETLSRWVEQANLLGLVVEVEEKDDEVLQSFSVTITRQQAANPTNMLEVVQNADMIRLHSLRTFHEGRWSNSARQYGYSGNSRELTVRGTKYAIEGLSH